MEYTVAIALIKILLGASVASMLSVVGAILAPTELVENVSIGIGLVCFALASTSLIALICML